MAISYEIYQMLNKSLSQEEIAKYTMAVAVTLTGVAAHRIRRFEDFGLVSPLRSVGRQRLFSDRDIRVIRDIDSLEIKGINLPGVKTILGMKQDE